MVERPATYVTLPGADQQFQWAPDINLADSDQAHFQQNMVWLNNSNAKGFVLDDTLTPAYGTKHGKFQVDGAAVSAAQASSGASDRRLEGVDPSQEYSTLMRMSAENVGKEGRVSMVWRDSGGGYLSESTGPYVPLSVGEWTDVTVTAGSHPNANKAQLVVTVRNTDGVGDLVDDEAFYMDSVCMRRGDVPEFQPSQRLVGNVEFILDSLMDWATYPDGGAVTRVLCAMDGNQGSPQQGLFRLNRAHDGTGRLYMGWRETDGSESASFVVYPTAWGDGERHTIRFTADVQTTPGSLIVKAYDEDDNEFFDQTYSGFSGFRPTVATASLGAYSNGETPWPFPWRVFGFYVRDGIGGPAVTDWVPDDQGQGVELAPEFAILPWPPPPIEPIGIP